MTKSNLLYPLLFDEVYNFALIHYASVGAIIHF